MNDIWEDPIVEEIYRTRECIMKECNDDMGNLVRWLMESQERHGDKLRHAKDCGNECSPPGIPRDIDPDPIVEEIRAIREQMVRDGYFKNFAAEDPADY